MWKPSQLPGSALRRFPADPAAAVGSAATAEHSDGELSPIRVSTRVAAPASAVRPHAAVEALERSAGEEMVSGRALCSIPHFAQLQNRNRKSCDMIRVEQSAR